MSCATLTATTVVATCSLLLSWATLSVLTVWLVLLSFTALSSELLPWPALLTHPLTMLGWLLLAPIFFLAFSTLAALFQFFSFSALACSLSLSSRHLQSHSSSFLVLLLTCSSSSTHSAQDSAPLVSSATVTAMLATSRTILCIIHSTPLIGISVACLPSPAAL